MDKRLAIHFARRLQQFNQSKYQPVHHLLFFRLHTMHLYIEQENKKLTAWPRKASSLKPLTMPTAPTEIQLYPSGPALDNASWEATSLEQDTQDADELETMLDLAENFGSTFL